ncbi:MAG: hypothetical protein HYY52_06710 [Candidatus Melainabacteria bacterium]|nr:hypothetical protein [Candidatus Melainabacteria bacterium]
MKSFISLLLILFLSGCSIQQLTQEEIQKIVTKVQNSKIIVLNVYHDRCESCKNIEPIIKELESDFSNNPSIAFLRYDLSNPFSIYNSRKIAKLVGLEDIYKAQRFSGIVLIVDTKSKQVLETLIAEYNKQKYVDLLYKKGLRAKI